MKKQILVMLLLTPMLVLAQVKGKKSKKAFKTSTGTEYKVGDMIQLKKASNKDKFAYVYINKSGFSFKSIAKAVKSVRDVKNLDVSSVEKISNTIDNVNTIANSELVSGAMSQLMGKAVSEKYVTENELPSSKEKSKYKIKSFKIYTDKDTDEKIVHAIAKGGGKTIAILLEFAEKTGEISK
jgi:hypothetical protein